MDGNTGAILKFFATNAKAHDRVTCAISYFGAVAEWQAKRVGYHPTVIKTIQDTASSAGSWRKIQRLFKSPNAWRNVIIMAMKMDFSMKKILSFLTDLFGSLYLIFDHMKYFHRVGIWRPTSKQQKDRVWWFTALFWCLETTFDFLGSIVQLGRILNNIEKGDKTNKTQKERDRLYRRVIKNFLDFPCAFQALKWFGVENWPIQIVGILGTIVGLLPLYDIWPKSIDSK